MRPPTLANLCRGVSGIVETVRYAPGALARDGVKQALNAIPGARSAWFAGMRSGVRTQRSLRGPVVLMYHRIAEQDPDPWGLSVSPHHFAEQMEVLAAHRHPMALTEFISGGKVSALPADAVAITFDDGYADNLLEAKPILERYRIPATVFVTSVAVDHPRELWWDELERVLLAPEQLPHELSLKINGRKISFPSGPDMAEDQSNRRGAFANRTGHRWLLYQAIHRELLAVPYAEKIRAVADLTSVLGAERGGGGPDRRLLRARELKELASCSLVEIGCHTETHPRLAGLAKDDQQLEISKNKSFLEGLLDRPISSFAYPHGSYDAQTVVCLRRAGFALACHTRPGSIGRGASPFELPRLHVRDCDGSQFFSALSRP
jgi:peptidoglycan/xylan/chitin deacetylase (PgdA/CDA1 family)